jgi:hypothetical protein
MGRACSKTDEIRNKYEILLGNLNRRNQPEDIGVGGRIILKRILEK